MADKKEGKPKEKKPFVKESYTIIDSVFAPDDKIKLDYKGPNPWRVYLALPKLMQLIYHGRGKNVFEDKFKWDITSDPRDFYFRLRYDDIKLDARTKFVTDILGLGRQHSDPNNPDSTVYIEIKCTITTKYDFANAFEKYIGMSFVWLYHRMYYNNIRRRYIQMLKEQTIQLMEAIRKELGVPLESPELSGAAARID
jgi:hypothetical protein